MSFYYYLPDNGETIDEAEDLPDVAWSEDAEDFAERAAEYCHQHRDAWGWGWPVTIVVVDNGVESRFIVEREYDPTFSATLSKAPAEEQEPS